MMGPADGEAFLRQARRGPAQGEEKVDDPFLDLAHVIPDVLMAVVIAFAGLDLAPKNFLHERESLPNKTIPSLPQKRG